MVVYGESRKQRKCYEIIKLGVACCVFAQVFLCSKDLLNQLQNVNCLTESETETDVDENTNTGVLN